MLAYLRQNAVAFLALFVAIGGTSYAAVQLPKDSVTSKQIAKNAVRTAEVKDGSLKAADFSSGTLLTGPPGPTGPTWAGANNAPVITPTSTAGLVDLWTFTSPRPGRLHVYATVDLSATDVDTDCISSGTLFEVFLDGVPVRGTLVVPTGGATRKEIDVHGLTGEVPAGSHTLQVGALCSGEDKLTDVELPSANLAVAGAILIGS